MMDMPKSKRHSSRKTPIAKVVERSVVPQAGGAGRMILGIGSPVLNPSLLKHIKIDPDPPDSYPKFCAWLAQILEFGVSDAIGILSGPSRNTQGRPLPVIK